MSRKAGWNGNKPGWTEDTLIEKAREWIDQYGEPPHFDDWNLTLLRKKAEKASDEARRAWEAYARYKDGDWPSYLGPKRVFGTWGKFRDAARARGIVWPDTPLVAARRRARES